MQRTTQFPWQALFVAFPRNGDGVGHDHNDAVQPRPVAIDRLDAVEIRANDLFVGRIARSKRVCQMYERLFSDLHLACGSSSFGRVAEKTK